MSPLRIALALAVVLSACNNVSTPAAGGALVGAQPVARASRPPATRLVKPTSPTSPTTPQTPSGAETGRLVGITAAHNEVRAQVGVAAVSWSTELGAHAQSWANQLAANGCNLQHRPAGSDSYGENLYWTTTSGESVGAVVGVWAAEKADYDHAANSCAGTCGHYTQVVWAATTQIGCGVATCANAEVWVCNYNPQGNVMGQSPY